MNSEKFKKALRIAVNVGCGFEGDAEDAASLLGLIEANEARIAELEAAQRDLREYIDELEAEKECEMRVFKDGNAWCFVLPDFQDLQVSSSVWMKEGVLDKIYKELRSVRNE